MRLKVIADGTLKIRIDDVWVNVFYSPTTQGTYGGVIRHYVRDYLQDEHINNSSLSLYKINKYAKALRDDYNNEYYFDTDHIIRWGRDKPMSYSYAFVINVVVRFENRDMNLSHTYNTKKKYTSTKDAELRDRAYNDFLRHLKDNTKEHTIKIVNLKYIGRVPINRWGRRISVNGSLLIPDLNFIDKTDDYILKENRCFYDLIMIECGIHNPRPKRTAMGEELYNIFFEVDKSYKRPRKKLRDNRYELLWEVLWGLPFKDAKIDRPTDKELWAVGLDQIKDFVKKYEMSFYICDAKSNIIYHNVGKKNGICIYALLDNGHLTPIPNRHVDKRRNLSKKAMTLIKATSIQNFNDTKLSDREIKIIEAKEAFADLKAPKNNIVWCRDKDDVYKYLKQHLENDKIYPTTIRCNTYNGLFSFSGFSMEIGNNEFNHYIIDNLQNKKDFDYYGKDYKGQSLIGDVVKTFDDEDDNKLPLSHMSKYLFDIFSNKDQKYKMPRGWRNGELFYGSLNKFEFDDDFKALEYADIDEHKNSKLVKALEYYDKDDKKNKLFNKLGWCKDNKKNISKILECNVKDDKKYNKECGLNIPDELLDDTTKSNLQDVRLGWRTFDICKCYRHIITNMREYYELGFNSVPIKFKGKRINKGFYYVNTDYNLLFTGSKWYSDDIVKKGLVEGIIDLKNIEYYIRPKKIHRGNYFNKLIYKLKDKYKGDYKGQKRAINAIAGLTQRHRKIKCNLHQFTNDAEEVASFINNNRQYARFDKVEGLWLYGSREPYNLYSNHLPIANQLLDKASILLYDKIKLLTDKKYPIVYLNTDSITIKNKDLKKDYKRHIKNNKNKRYGDLVEENKTYLLKVEYGDNIYKGFLVDNSDNYVLDDLGINDSAEWDKYCELIDNKKSVMTMGDGGTGKSYIINQLDKEFKLCKVAFTNKATNKIGGKTYHREFILPKDKKIDKKMIDRMRNKKYKAIVAEEFSMNNWWIWRLLEIMSVELDIPILAFGDWKQLPPVKDYVKYKEHLVVKSIFDYKTTLTKNYRADKLLVNLFNKYATNMNEFPLDNLTLQPKIRYVNICWTNKKRKFVNENCANEFNRDKKSYLSYAVCDKKESENNTYDDNDDDDDDSEFINYTQNIYVSVGMPMICRKSKCEEYKDDKEFLYYYNNEMWEIVKIHNCEVSLKDQIDNEYTAEQLKEQLGTKSNKKKDELIKLYIKTKKPKHNKNNVVVVELKSTEREGADIPPPNYIIPLDKLQNLFLVAFCITTHKAQGDTIDKEFNIYEWNRMNNALKYTALSRTKSHKKVCVIR